MPTTPQIENQFNAETATVQLPSKTYKLNFNVITTIDDHGVNKVIEADKIAGFVNNLEAVKQAIYHILMTERYKYTIYDDNYGVELQQYVGKRI